MTLSPTWIGIDVSKAWLDIASSGGEGVQRIANTMDAIAAFAATLEREGTLVVLEASGVYDRSLRAGLALAGIGHVRVNPQRARDFARASGQLAKTDALDAAMLAEMGRALRLVADPLPEAGRERLGLLSRRRDQLVAMRTQEKQRRIEIADPFIGADLDRHLAGLNQAIAAIEGRNPEPDRQRCRPGTGPGPDLLGARHRPGHRLCPGRPDARTGPALGQADRHPGRVGPAQQR